MNALTSQAGISPRASLPAACPPNPGRRDPSKAERARELLERQKLDLEVMLELNAACECDTASRFILDGLASHGSRYLRRIENALLELRRAPDFMAPLILGRFGKNGADPAIRSIVRDAEFQRALAIKVGRKG